MDTRKKEAYAADPMLKLFDHFSANHEYCRYATTRCRRNVKRVVEFSAGGKHWRAMTREDVTDDPNTKVYLMGRPWDDEWDRETDLDDDPLNVRVMTADQIIEAVEAFLCHVDIHTLCVPAAH